VGHLTFQNIFGKNPHHGTPQVWSNQIKYCRLGEVISLNFIVVVVYILQIIDRNCQAFLFIPLMLCVMRGKSSANLAFKVIKSNVVVSILQKQRALYTDLYHVELNKSCISSETIRYNFLSLKQKKECTMFSYTNLAFQVIQSDI